MSVSVFCFCLSVYVLLFCAPRCVCLSVCGGVFCRVLSLSVCLLAVVCLKRRPSFSFTYTHALVRVQYSFVRMGVLQPAFSEAGEGEFVGLLRACTSQTHSRSHTHTEPTPVPHTRTQTHITAINLCTSFCSSEVYLSSNPLITHTHTQIKQDISGNSELRSMVLRVNAHLSSSQPSPCKLVIM